MMSDNITAEWARKEANEVLGKKVSEELDRCETAIVLAVKQNKMTCSVSLCPHEKTTLELSKRGFKVIEHPEHNQREPGYITINW